MYSYVDLIHNTEGDSDSKSEREREREKGRNDGNDVQPPAIKIVSSE